MTGQATQGEGKNGIRFMREARFERAEFEIYPMERFVCTPL